jgi:hypothetical protein
MNIKVTLTFIATEEDWCISDLLDEVGSLQTEEAQEIIRKALLEDPSYVIELAEIAIKEDFKSI